ncbi:hypothetical protein L9F63_020582 [Diploptera punctata]|uniref:Phospholysine phosphohistidine inorganic pyrophosphate phosphatase n=1 Tax=Diploptera punctata TaxID=6984 RepID=A0AAD8ECS1_DIPPU|nr:hypothetical protein L9F63_020582 [Diploptera punctata]
MSLLKNSRLNGVLLDITGVLKDGGSAIPGSVEAVKKLRDAGLVIRLVTNETQITRRSMASSLHSLGHTLLVHPDVLPEFEGIDQSNPNCVVIGDAAEIFTYENLNEACVYNCTLEYAADVKAEVIGKPQAEFFRSALDDMGMKADEAVMVGDDLVSDVGGAQRCGLTGVLVRTGKYRPVDEMHPTVHPDAIANDLAQAVDIILESRK